MIKDQAKEILWKIQGKQFKDREEFEKAYNELFSKYFGYLEPTNENE